jgi:peptidoglycan hydrolase CwlO-like protein
MNLIGKIFTVLILVMSLVFASFAAAIYATHKNWREVVENKEPRQGVPLGLVWQLEKEKQENERLKTQRRELEKKLEAERTAKDQAIAKLETERDQLKRERDELQQQLAKLDKEWREYAADIKVTHAALAAKQEEVLKLRAEILQAQRDRDEYFKGIVKATDQMHQTANEVARLRNLNVQLTEQLATAMEVLRKFGLKSEPRLYEGMPPDVQGLVLAAGSDGLVEISIGSDDGLLKGHRLDVYRIGGGATSYVGKIEVIRTAPERAVCKVLPETVRAPGGVMKWDRVISRIQ